MKILQVTNFFKPIWDSGGVARVAYEVSRYLKNRGHEITIYTTNRSIYQTDLKTNSPINLEGMKVYYFENLRKYFPRILIPVIPYYMLFVVRRQIKNFDIIHMHEHRTLLAIFAHLYARKYGIPYVVQSHGSVLPIFANQRLKKLFDIIWGYKILKDAAKVIALTKKESEQYKRMGINEDKIEIVPNGINLSDYENLPKKGEFRKKYSISNDKKIILSLGRIHKIKGIDLLINAFAEMKRTDEMVLVIVGPGSDFLLTLKKQVKTLQIKDSVLFIPPLYGEDKLEAYVDADVYVLPSRYETFPVTVLEVCACGIPVVMTDRCGIANLVDKKIGLVVKYDKNMLKETILKFISDDELRKKFGNEGRRFIKESFTWKKAVDKLEEIYSELVVERDNM